MKTTSLKTIAVLTLSTIACFLIFYIPFPHSGIAYFPDEGVWSAVGKYTFQKFFVEQDWSYITWSNNRFGDFGPANPPLGKYIIGAALFWSGQVDKDTVFPGYEFTGPFAWEKVNNQTPPPQILQTARWPIRILGILSVIVLFFLLNELGLPFFSAWFACLLFSLQPLVIESSQRAMMDTPVLFFSLLTCLLAVLLLKRLWLTPNAPYIIYAFLLGIVLGLALSTKLNALLTLMVILAWGVSLLLSSSGILLLPISSYPTRFVVRFRQDARLLKAMLISGICFSLTAVLIFLLLNPFLYRHPVRNSIYIVGLGRRVANYEIPPEQKLDTWGKRWQTLVSITLERSGILHYWLKWPFVDQILVFVGGLACALQIFNQRKTITIRLGHTWIFLWFAITFMGVLLWTPFNWSRWYLPLSPVWAIFEALGIMFLVGGLQRQWVAYVSSRTV